MSEPSGAFAPLALAREYLAAKGNTFWRWSDDGEVLTWPSGETIVFREELRTIVERLTPSGLPPLGALLLLLAACREGGSERDMEQRIVTAIFGEMRDDPLLRIPTAFHDALDGLALVAKLPAELRRGVAAKATIAETVFDANRPLPPAVGRALVSVLAGTFDFDIFESVKPQRPLAGVIMALSELRRGLSRLHPDSLTLRLRTGLDQLVHPAKAELPPEESLRDFVARLRSDPELEGLGRLARDLMAAVQLPRAISDPEELPLGGVSDVANRGPLDRLLVSELAHDDLTLAVRVALNEALYLRRESPPKTPPSNRLVLIDCGIRLWGVPRVFATAAALALAATGDRRAQVGVFRAERDEIAPVELHTRAGLIAHLEKLETAPHPAAALRPFLDQVVEAGRADAVLVTHEDVLADAEFRRELAAHDEPLYVATVARDGRFRLLLASRRGLRPVREAIFDLQTMLAPAPRPAVPLLRPNSGTDLPAILAVEPFPLLLPHPIDPRQAIYHAKHGAVTVTKDGRLLHWPRLGQGGRQMSAAVPKGKVWIVSVGDEGAVRVVVGGEQRQPLWLVRADLAGGGCHVRQISTDADAPRQVVECQQTLFAVYDRHVETVVCEDETRAWIELPSGVSWRRGRYFSDGDAWYALAFDGLAPVLERVPLRSKLKGQDVLVMFDRKDFDGPWAVTTKAEVVWTILGDSLTSRPALEPPVAVHAVARNGQHIALRQLKGTLAKRRSGVLVTLCMPGPQQFIGWPMTSVVLKGDPRMAVEPELARFTRAPTLRRGAQGVGVGGTGLISLLIEGNREARLDFDPAERTLRWSPPQRRTDAYPIQSLRPVESPEGTRIELAVAAWPDGTRIWLDGRGLLHLRSSDPRQPQVTLVLVCDKPVAGWTSDGKLWGTPYFTGVERAWHVPNDVVRFLQTFTAKLRCST